MPQSSKALHLEGSSEHMTMSANNQNLRSPQIPMLASTYLVAGLHHLEQIKPVTELQLRLCLEPWI